MRVWPKFEWYAQLRRHIDRAPLPCLRQVRSRRVCSQSSMLKQNVHSATEPLTGAVISRYCAELTCDLLCAQPHTISLSHFFEAILLTMIEMLAGIFIVQITHGDLYDPCIIVLGCAIIMFSAELFHMGIKSNSLVTVYHKSKCTRSNCEMPLPCCLCHHSKILKD